ncbi:MAG: HK97 family phage prohead protease [Parvularculaceae bacterium]
MRNDLQIRQVADVRRDGPRKLAGLAAIYDRETEIGGTRERIARGAFAETIRSDAEVLAFVDHDAGKLLGRRSVGTLRLSDSDEGLAFEIDLPETTLGRDVLALAERGDLGGMSFGFTVPKSGERRDGNVRVLTQIDLKEISVVSSWPAYQGTRVEARNWHAANKGGGHLPQFLRRWRY